MRVVLKKTCLALATLLILPIYVCYWLTMRLTSADQSLESYSQLLSMFPGKTGNYLRLAFYRLSLESCDPTATICFGVLFSKTAARIGAHVYIGPRCMIGWVTLEDDVLLGPAVQITSGPHIHGIASLDTPIRNQPGKPQQITIGRNSWIGAGSIVMADVGSQTVIGANSTVTRKIPSQMIAVGSPAKPILSRGEKSADHFSQTAQTSDPASRYSVSANEF